jgi:hypothetical protein
MSHPDSSPSRQSQYSLEDLTPADLDDADLNDDPETISHADDDDDDDSANGDEWTDTAAAQVKTQRKRQMILDACRESDIEQLRVLAQESGGFLDDSLRRQAWPILLGPPEQHHLKDTKRGPPWQTLPPHKDEDQVALDVKRAFIYYPRGKYS